MICHKHKCIFVHIPRCGGTSIEIDLVGKNWFKIEPKTKHLVASTAKRIYRPYWDEYFKFSFVRNPWDRMVSMGKYSRFYGVYLKDNMIDFTNYFKKFSPIEIDPRSLSCKEKFHPIKNSVYLNILNVELDYIGRFENLDHDYREVCRAIGKSPTTLINDVTHQSEHKHYTYYYDDITREKIAYEYARDIEHFGYKFEE